MSLNKIQLDKLNKNEIIEYTMEIQEKYNENLGIADQLKQAMNEISDIKSTVVKLNDHITELESTLSVTKNVLGGKDRRPRTTGKCKFSVFPA